jgi:hypothetical protein
VEMGESCLPLSSLCGQEVDRTVIWEVLTSEMYEIAV